MTLIVLKGVKTPLLTLRLNNMKTKPNPCATIGYTNQQLDRREAILEAKRRRDELRSNHAKQNQWAWAFVA